jgi:hypothetical protein
MSVRDSIRSAVEGSVNDLLCGRCDIREGEIEAAVGRCEITVEEIIELFATSIRREFPLTAPTTPHPGDVMAILGRIETLGGSCSLTRLAGSLGIEQALVWMTIRLAAHRGQITTSPTGCSIALTAAGREALTA